MAMLYMSSPGGAGSTASEIVTALTPPPPPPPEPTFPWGLLLVAGGVGYWLYTRKKGKAAV